MRAVLITALLFGLCLAPAAAPARAQVVQTATAAREAAVYAGPSQTCPTTDILFDEAQVIVIARNSVGTWLRVQLPNATMTAALIEGWVWRGDLDLDPALAFSAIPVADSPDACLETITDPVERAIAEPPIIGALTEAMRAVYARGQMLGIRPNAVTKVGDSLSADVTYLNPIAMPGAIFGPYDYLADTIAYFGPQMDHYSVAARRGLTSQVAFDSMWADPGRCEPGESPVACEYRLAQPLMSFIMFGANDQIAMDTAEYEASMRALVQYTVDQGIIPVLSTYSFPPDYQRAQEAGEFNLVIIRLAEDFGAPLINLWLAARPLPRYGLEGDDIHMRLAGYQMVMLADNVESRFGGALRNLLTFRMMDEIRRSLGLG